MKKSSPLTPVCDGDFAINPKFCGLAGDGEFSSVYAGCYQSEGLPTSLHGDCYLHLSHLLQVNLFTQRLLSPLVSPLLYSLSTWICYLHLCHLLFVVCLHGFCYLHLSHLLFVVCLHGFCYLHLSHLLFVVCLHGSATSTCLTSCLWSVYMDSATSTSCLWSVAFHMDFARI